MGTRRDLLLGLAGGWVIGWVARDRRSGEGFRNATATRTAAEEGTRSATGLRPAFERKVLAEINEAREELAPMGGPLSRDNRLAQAARYQARHMADIGEVTHEGPSGEDLEERYQKFGVLPGGVRDGMEGKIEDGWEHVGRAGSADDAAELVGSWKSSRRGAEIMSAKWLYAGVGAAAESGGVYVAVNYK